MCSQVPYDKPHNLAYNWNSSMLICGYILGIICDSRIRRRSNTSHTVICRCFTTILGGCLSTFHLFENPDSLCETMYFNKIAAQIFPCQFGFTVSSEPSIPYHEPHRQQVCLSQSNQRRQCDSFGKVCHADHAALLFYASPSITRFHLGLYHLHSWRRPLSGDFCTARRLRSL